MKILIKREQSQTSLNFAEREKFRPQVKQLISLLFALLYATTAWATDYTVGTDEELRAAIANDGANITVTADINLSNSTLSIAEGTTVTIDLGSHTLDRQLTKRGEGGGQVITIRKGATLNLSNGTLTGGWGGAGGALVNEGGTVTLTDVIITHNVADDRGGGICNREGGTLTMTGGVITDNSSNDRSGAKGGGGLFNEKGATATLTGVTITGNKNKTYGGGGICNFGTLNIDGCTITGNTAGANGGAIWQEGTLNLQGKNTITDNQAGGKANNVYLYNTVITVTGSLEGSQIGIKMERAKTFTSGYNTHNSGVAPSTLFSEDNPQHNMVLHNNEGCLSLDYLECSWDSENKQVVTTTKTLYEEIGFDDTPTSEEQYKVVTSSDVEKRWIGTENSSLHEYYVVLGNVNIHRLILDGPNVHIIICDNAKIEATGLSSHKGHTLYIQVQSYESAMGKLYITSSNNFGIGGYNPRDLDSLEGGTVEIHGGDIQVKNVQRGSPAIGGVYYDRTCVVKIFGGNIDVVGGTCAAGIGGCEEDCKDFGTITIYGGTIKTKGGYKYGAGIGAGYSSSKGTVHIYGGDINATGGGESAGIGSSQYTAGNDNFLGKIIIDGGHIVARGTDYGAGIGGGDGINGGTITINGGEVYAYGATDAAGIGGGEGGDAGTITITGGYVYAEGGWEYGAGIGGGQDGGGGNITITGGTVIAKAGVPDDGDDEKPAAIGKGSGSGGKGTLTLGDDRCVYITNNLWRSKKENRVSDCWGTQYAQISECLHGGATASVVNGDKHNMSNCKWCYVTGEEAHSFGDDSQCDACGLIRLADEGDNSALFTKWNDGDAHDFLLNRQKLVPNEEGASRAYTVCLPFDMDLSEHVDDLTLYTLSYIKDGSEMVFTQTEKKIEAGKPYLIVMHQGELELLGHSKLITTADEGVRVYDWTNREQLLGWWRGTLTKIESADAAEMMAYALQSVGDFRRIRPDTPYAWWGAFRSMYCPDELPGTNRFTIDKGTFGGFGGNTPDITFEGDAEIGEQGDYVSWDSLFVDKVWAWRDGDGNIVNTNNTKDGITVTFDGPGKYCGFAYGEIYFYKADAKLTFTSTVGEISRIEISGTQIRKNYPDGWTWVPEEKVDVSYYRGKLIWEGTPTTSVDMNGSDDTIDIKDISKIVFTVSGKPTAIGNISQSQGQSQPRKLIKDGQLLIKVNGKTYNVAGVRLK